MYQFIVFCIVIVVLYFILINVPIYHEDEVVGSTEHFSSLKRPDMRESDFDVESEHLTMREVLLTVKNKLEKPEYKFNIVGLPVTQRMSTASEKYLVRIRKEIDSWNDLLSDDDRGIQCLEIKPLVLLETDNEFIIKVAAKVKYYSEVVSIVIAYYGKITKDNDFLIYDRKKLNYKYVMQLFELKIISDSMFFEDNSVPFRYDADELPSGILNQYNKQKMTCQNDYVKIIDKMHRDEADNNERNQRKVI